MSDIENYLCKFVNKTECLSDLLKLFAIHAKCSIVSLFIKVDDDVPYHCLSHHDKGCNGEALPMFTPRWLETTETGTQTNVYRCQTPVDSYMIIPLRVEEDSIGAVVLANHENKLFSQENLNHKLLCLISISQLIIKKEKLICEYKKVYSDENYFSKDLFLANMSHEIKTPLHGMIGYAQLLQQTALNLNQQSYLGQINQCGVQLMRIINDVLDFSKLASGHMSIQSDCFTLQDMVMDVQNAVMQRVKAKKQKLGFAFSDGVPEWVVMDKHKLVQILVNLVINASHFSGVGKDILVSLHYRVVKNTHHVFIEVIDHGVGIAEHDQCKLFNSFVQIRQSLTKTGTGLGLAISKKLAELLKGSLDVKSQVGVGSTFSLLCPFVPYADHELTIYKSGHILQGKRVLLVDDLLENRMLIGEMLFDWSTKPVMCSSGIEALRFLADNRFEFDVGLIDICMPEISGVELAKKIKEIRPLFPLIALSSLADFIDTSDFHYKLNKPFKKSHLFHAIEAVLGGDLINEVSLQPELAAQPLTRTSSSSATNFSMLVVEDVGYNRSLFVNILKMLAYEDVDEAADGVDAISALGSKCYDIVFLDLRMPRVDGYGVIHHMQENNLLDHTTIVAVTASVMNEDREKCQREGVKYFLQKPIQLNQLKYVILQIAQTPNFKKTM
jgi:two-component system sensor histidine kinase/response regulator